MFNRRVLAFTTAFFLLIFLGSNGVLAGQKTRSGSYQGRKTSGTWR